MNKYATTTRLCRWHGSGPGATNAQGGFFPKEGSQLKDADPVRPSDGHPGWTLTHVNMRDLPVGFLFIWTWRRRRGTD